MPISLADAERINNMCPAATGALGSALFSAQKQLLPLAFQGTLGHDAGPGADGVLIGTLADQDITYAFGDDGGVFTDYSTEANEATDDDVILLPAAPAVDDAFYFGHDAKFSAIVIGQSTQGNWTGTIAWEYYDEDEEDWQALDVEDMTAGLEGTGNDIVSFAPPTDWGQCAVNGTTAYWVRARVATYVAVVQSPIGDQIWVLDLTHGSGLRMVAPGSVVGVQFTADTASGTADDSQFLIINVTKGTYVAATWTGGDVMDRVGDLSLAFDAGDELAVQQVVEDGATEFAGANIVLELQYGA